jgi:hypothetical protein
MRSLAVLLVLAAAPLALRAQAARTIAKYGFNDGVVQIDVRAGARIAIAGAQGDNAATVTVRAADARAWVDSTRRLLTRAAPRRRSALILQRSMIHEAADSGAALSFIRRAEASASTYSLFFSARQRGGFPLALDKREATLFFSAMSRAVDATRPPRAHKPKKRPS